MEDQHQDEAIIRQLMPGENVWSEEIRFYLKNENCFFFIVIFSSVLEATISGRIIGQRTDKK